jgi:hypothetical protein
MEAVRQNGWTFRYVPEKLRERVRADVEEERT